MADIALAFGWTPQDMNAMRIDELARWRERARVRLEPAKETR